MSKPTDIRAAAAELFFLPVETRVPLKCGPETLTHVTCARVRLTVRLANGTTATAPTAPTVVVKQEPGVKRNPRGPTARGVRWGPSARRPVSVRCPLLP